jgi:hypothetical protein
MNTTMKVMGAMLLIGVGTVIGRVASSAPTAAAPAAREELDPVKVAPTTHKLLFENEYVKVIEAKIPPGVHDAKHAHKKGVLVFLADYDMQMKSFPKGDSKTVHRTAKTVVWSDPLVHETVNIGKTTSHAIRIELKDPAPAK